MLLSSFFFLFFSVLKIEPRVSQCKESILPLNTAQPFTVLGILVLLLFFF